jgi:hypothetical protein
MAPKRLAQTAVLNREGQTRRVAIGRARPSRLRGPANDNHSPIPSPAAIRRRIVRTWLALVGLALLASLLRWLAS